MADTKLINLTEITNPALADILYLTADPGSTPLDRKCTLTNLQSLLAAGGWMAADALTYATSDAPTYTVTCTGNQTAKYYPGMRLKLTDSTVKYFIITDVAYTSSTTLTLYGGTDYTLSGGAITSPYYSSAKAPTGFPLNKAKWTVTLEDTTSRSQAATQSTYYSPGALSITVPIGAWNFGARYSMRAAGGQAGQVQIQSGIQTVNNNITDLALSAFMTGYTYTNTAELVQTVNLQKYILLASKTVYYPVIVSFQNSGTTTIYFANDKSTMIVEAICAYL